MPFTKMGVGFRKGALGNYTWGYNYSQGALSTLGPRKPAEEAASGTREATGLRQKVSLAYSARREEPRNKLPSPADGGYGVLFQAPSWRTG